MAVLTISFKPKEANQYLVQWKKRTDSDYVEANSRVVTKTMDEYNTVVVNGVDNVDYDYQVWCLCNGHIFSKSSFKGVAVAVAEATTSDAVFINDICPVISDITLESGA